MAVETETNKTEVEKFADFLKELQIKVLQSNGSNDLPCNEEMGWDYPPIGKKDIAERLNQIVDYIETHKFNESDEFHNALSWCKKAFSEWSQNPLNHLYHNSYSKFVVFNFLLIVERTENALRAFDGELLTKDLQSHVKHEQKRISALRARVDSVEESVGGVQDAVKRITEADKAAIQLPETLSSLNTAKDKIVQTEKTVQEAERVVLRARDTAEKQREFLVDAENQVKDLLEKSKAVLATATSAGLAGAFYDRKKELQIIGWVWTGGLIVALLGALAAIVWRADHLFALLDRANEIGTFTLVANFVISIGFIGAPIWFAWLATKQVGYYFRLSEDYAFKASVSASYEGFMEEARGHDAEFERKVLESTLERYDEPPLRFVDSRVHGSPYQELFDSEEFRSAMKNIPGFKDRVIGAIKGCLKVPEKNKTPEATTPSVDPE